MSRNYMPKKKPEPRITEWEGFECWHCKDEYQIWDYEFGRWYDCMHCKDKNTDRMSGQIGTAEFGPKE